MKKYNTGEMINELAKHPKKVFTTLDACGEPVKVYIGEDKTDEHGNDIVLIHWGHGNTIETLYLNPGAGKAGILHWTWEECVDPMNFSGYALRGVELERKGVKYLFIQTGVREVHLIDMEDFNRWDGKNYYNSTLIEAMDDLNYGEYSKFEFVKANEPTN